MDDDGATFSDRATFHTLKVRFKESSTERTILVAREDG